MAKTYECKVIDVNTGICQEWQEANQGLTPQLSKQQANDITIAILIVFAFVFIVKQIKRMLNL